MKIIIVVLALVTPFLVILGAFIWSDDTIDGPVLVTIGISVFILALTYGYYHG